MKQTSHLYECRNCGGLTASNQLSCPYCGSSDGGVKERNTINGATELVSLNWFERVELVGEDNG